MLAEDESALVCDFAQYYGVHDFRQLKLSHAAVLAVGLPEKARIKLKLSGQYFDLQTMLLAHLVDYMAIDIWFQTKDGHRGRNRPASIASVLSGKEKKEEKDMQKAFASAEAFEAERQKILEGINNGGLRTGESLCTDHTDNKGHKRKSGRSARRGR